MRCFWHPCTFLFWVADCAASIALKYFTYVERMNSIKPLFIILILLMAVVTAGKAQFLSFTIQNTTAVERSNELVTLKRSEIENSLGKKTTGQSLLLQINSVPQPVQYVDVNNDGQWDKIVFLCSLRPNQTLPVALHTEGGAADTSLKPLAHVRMKPRKAGTDSFAASITQAVMPPQNPPTDFSKDKLPPYLTEGPGWENDKVAFRLYFDTRNTKDIFGKRIPAMVLDSVGTNPANSYHNLAGWGMDILRVGKSLGAGSLAIATQDETGKDTLIRLGADNILKETYQQIADGPLYAAFTMDYVWQINNSPVTITEEISIWGGQYFYQSKVTITGAPQGARLVTGIADFNQNTSSSMQVDKAAVLYSHGRQSENKDELGMALLLPAAHFAQFGKAPKAASDVLDTHLASLHIVDGQPLTFRFYACWKETHLSFAQPAYFRQFVIAEAMRFSNPLQLK